MLLEDDADRIPGQRCLNSPEQLIKVLATGWYFQMIEVSLSDLPIRRIHRANAVAFQDVFKNWGDHQMWKGKLSG